MCTWFLVLLSLAVYSQSGFALDSSSFNFDEIRLLKIRVAQLEKYIGKEKFISDNLERPNEDSSSTPRKAEYFPIIQENKFSSTSQENSEIKNCDDRILTLERTVLELSMVITKHTEYKQRFQRLEERVEEQERVIFDLRRQISENELPIPTYENEETLFEGKGIRESTFSGEVGTGEHGMENDHIKDNKDNNNSPEGTLNKNNFRSERLLFPVTTTTRLPNLPQSVAFYAHMSQHTQTISVQYPLRFDVVKTNVGHGYHSPTGIFIVPESGTYVFSWTIRVYGDERHSTQLMVNTDELGILHTHAASGSDFEGTGIVVIQVNAGDDVFVRTHESWNAGAIRSDAAGRTSFSGWKLS